MIVVCGLKEQQYQKIYLSYCRQFSFWVSALRGVYNFQLSSSTDFAIPCGFFDASYLPKSSFNASLFSTIDVIKLMVPKWISSPITYLALWLPMTFKVVLYVKCCQEQNDMAENMASNLMIYTVRMIIASNRIR